MTGYAFYSDLLLNLAIELDKNDVAGIGFSLHCQPSLRLRVKH